VDCCSCAALSSAAPADAVEVHDVLNTPASTTPQVALTLDACSGHYDADLIRFLIDKRIPATIFATQRWISSNPAGVAEIKAHLDLFDVEDHGEHHIPAVIGAGRKVYGIPGEPDLVHLRQEVEGGASAITAAFGVAPHWYRGATAIYDAQATAEINRLGYGIAGFSVNADQGATLKRDTIATRLKHIHSGDVIIAHMNKPASDSAEGLSIGLQTLLDKGFRFVRLDQVKLQQVK
jgi:peptidoglycan/xylan/chitin deacetylase (PgdA/CDA1 family)